MWLLAKSNFVMDLKISTYTKLLSKISKIFKSCFKFTPIITSVSKELVVTHVTKLQNKCHCN